MKLLAVRGALNLFYLLGAQDKKAQADSKTAEAECAPQTVSEGSEAEKTQEGEQA